MARDQLILNRYRPISEAGSGGFATVQVAWDTRIQRRVAIKCIRLNEVDAARVAQPVDQAGVQSQVDADGRIVSGPLPQVTGLDEARTAALLTDASIVGVYDFEVQGATAYLIMEYVDGMTLTRFLRQFAGQLSLDAVAAIFSGVAQALEVAHDNQVLHLDIKPDNVIINRQGQVKVTDFGLAKLSDASGFGSAAGGTIGYMPPEQMKREALDARCDEWALASLTYEMLVGENPFLAPDIDQAIGAIENAELVLPSLCFEGLSSETDDVLFYALDPDREERYRSVADFAEEMQGQLGDALRGRKELAVLVGQGQEDYEGEEEMAERISFFDRLGDRGHGIISRFWGVASVALLGAVSIGHIPAAGGFTSPFFWGLLALFVLAAALKPHLGAALGLLSLVAAFFINEAFLAGFFLLAASGAWWFFIGRKGDSQANAALGPVLFGAIGFNQVTPLLTGLFLSIREALFTALFAIMLSIMLAGFGSGSFLGWDAFGFMILDASDFQHAPDLQQNMLALMQRPSTWCIALSWVVSAITVSIFCLRQTRLFASMGIVASTAILFGGLCLGTAVDTGFASWLPTWQALAFTGAAGAITLFICGFGVPARTIEEEA